MHTTAVRTARSVRWNSRICNCYHTRQGATEPQTWLMQMLVIPHSCVLAPITPVSIIVTQPFFVSRPILFIHFSIPSQPVTYWSQKQNIAPLCPLSPHPHPRNHAQRCIKATWVTRPSPLHLHLSLTFLPVVFETFVASPALASLSSQAVCSR